MKDLDVIGVRVELPSNQPLVLLREHGGARFLPIWIGTPEASAIAFEQQGIRPPRPLTHDLFLNAVTALGYRIASVVIVEVEDAIFHAELIFDNGVRVGARASDAIAMALRANCPLLCVDEVLDSAGVHMDGAEEAAADSGEGHEAQLRTFREFLDHIEPEDFGH